MNTRLHVATPITVTMRVNYTRTLNLQEEGLLRIDCHFQLQTKGAFEDMREFYDYLRFLLQ